MLLHKGFIGNIEFDERRATLTGEVLNAPDLLEFDGETASQIKENFIKCVEDYCQLHHQQKQQQSIPFIGNYSIRLASETQTLVMRAAKRENSSMETWLNRRLNDHLRDYFKEDVA